jgi:hypothetical protein
VTRISGTRIRDGFRSRRASNPKAARSAQAKEKRMRAFAGKRKDCVTGSSSATHRCSGVCRPRAATSALTATTAVETTTRLRT